MFVDELHFFPPSDHSKTFFFVYNLYFQGPSYQLLINVTSFDVRTWSPPESGSGKVIAVFVREFLAARDLHSFNAILQKYCMFLI